MKFAAILGAAVLGCAGAASAAEVGVQSTWGHSNTVITNGRYMSETTGASLYVEGSQSWAYGESGKFDFDTTTTNTPGEDYVLLGDLEAAVTTETVDVDSRKDRRVIGFFGGNDYRDVQDVDVIGGGLESLEVQQGNVEVENNAGDYAFQSGGGSARRLEIGGSFSRTTDSYEYTGTRSSGFSGISAFTR